MQWHTQGPAADCQGNKSKAWESVMGKRSLLYEEGLESALRL